MTICARIIAVLLVIYGLAGPIASNFVEMEKTPNFWATAIGCSSVGIFFLLSTFKLQLPSIPPISSIFGFLRIFKRNDIVKLTGISLKPSKLEDLDNKYVYFLANRARQYKDEELIDILRQVSKKFFVLHHQPEKINDKKTDDSSPAITST